jgi:uncharacterized protein (DUF169 family)
MESRIARKLRLRYPPVALTWAETRPEKAAEFKEGKWGCVMWMVARAARGGTAVSGRKTFGCWGGGVGLGFGDVYKQFPGGEDCFCYFLSIGNDQWETGRQMAEKVKPHMNEHSFDHFMHGERYMESPEQVKRFIRGLPIADIPAPFVVFKPLIEVDDEAACQVVIFFADPDQLSALVILANYGRETNENVIIPYAAGCQTIGIYPYREAESGVPRAVVGLTDISARTYIRQQLGDHLMTFAVPLKMFQEMEVHVEDSFLERPVWEKLAEGKPDGRGPDSA